MRIIILSILILFTSTSCKKNETSAPEGKIVIDSTDAKNNNKQNETLCFEFSKNKDTTDVSFTITSNNKVSGKMHWNPDQKDGAIGILKGTKKGDTIFADFDYVIEGMKQLEAKVFVLKNNQLFELNGELEEIKGKLVIKNLQKATVTNMLLVKDCSTIKFPN